MRQSWRGRSFLTRLARDVRGNTLALAAAAMFPLAGVIGGGVDMSRLYLTKTRLQQACDAGVLAGRKAMGTGSWNTNSNARALQLFSVNFQSGAYGTGDLTRNFTEDNGVVTGTASVAVPMTIMRIFGVTTRMLDVTCTARMEIPNTDVMFVLDMSGSMNCVAGDKSCTNNGNVPAPGGKIGGLKTAVKCFYEALLKVNTAEVCGDDPATTSYTQTAQIRIGFAPYSVNVNVGKLLPNGYLADQWTYQSREYSWDGETYNSTTSNGNWTYVSGSTSDGSANNQSSCPSDTYHSSTTTSTPIENTAQDGTVTITYTETKTETGRDNSCSRKNGKYNVNYTDYNNYVTQRIVTTTKKPKYQYTYKPITFDVSALKAGDSNWENSLSLPVGTAGSTVSVGWDGCIEERQTVKNSDGDPSDEWDPIPAAAYDMDIDRMPDPAVSGSQWGPMLPDAVWGRYSGSSNVYGELKTTSNLSHNISYYCTTEARKLRTWYTPSDFESYVNSLNAIGNTYHDIGMVWGARLISPTGIFASENATTPTGGPIQRHIIFMTDGDTMSYNDDYNAYGISWWDRRQTTYAPANGNGTNSDTSKIINAHLDGLCTAIKNKNITLWVISYGGGINATTEGRLQACATSGHYYSASDSAALLARFKQIASEIAQLRLTS